MFIEFLLFCAYPQLGKYANESKEDSTHIFRNIDIYLEYDLFKLGGFILSYSYIERVIQNSGTVLFAFANPFC